MSKYIDPPNANEIIEEIKNLGTLGEIRELVDRVFPGFIIGIIPKFSKDYAAIQKNWEIVCSRIGIQPAQILIISDYFFQDGYNLAKVICETFTRVGFCVRRYDEYIMCNGCGNAIATENNYLLLKKLGQQVPTIWSNKCSTC